MLKNKKEVIEKIYKILFDYELAFLNGDDQEATRKTVEIILSLLSSQKEEWIKYRTITTKINKAMQDEELQEPYMIHQKENGTDCCYCSICGESEMNIQDNKNKKGEYFCKCSLWDSSYEGEWIKWIDDDGSKAKYYRDTFYPNYYNQGLSKAIEIIKEEK